MGMRSWRAGQSILRLPLVPGRGLGQTKGERTNQSFQHPCRRWPLDEEVRALLRFTTRGNPLASAFRRAFWICYLSSAGSLHCQGLWRVSRDKRPCLEFECSYLETGLEVMRSWLGSGLRYAAALQKPRLRRSHYRKMRHMERTFAQGVVRYLRLRHTTCDAGQSSLRASDEEDQARARAWMAEQIHTVREEELAASLRRPENLIIPGRDFGDETRSMLDHWERFLRWEK